MNTLVFFQENLFSDLQTPVLNNGSSDITPRYRDVHFLISQEHLEALDPSALSKFLEPLKTSSSTDLQLSDDDLFSVVQSRYIQQPSDVQDFANFLKNTADDIKQKFTDEHDRQQKWDDFKNSLKRHVSQQTSDATLSDK